MPYKPSELDIHSEEAGYQSRRHEHQRHQGEDLHDLVLVEVDNTQYSILKVLEPLETEVGVVDKRRYILEEYIQTRLIFLRVIRTLEDAGDNPLLVDDVLTDEHGVLLQNIDVDEEFLADIFSDADLPVVLVDLLGNELHHIGIKVDTVFQNAEESQMSRIIYLRECHQPSLQVSETLQRTLSQCRKDIIRKYERNRLFIILIRTRNQEAGIGEDGFLCLGKT